MATKKRKTNKQKGTKDNRDVEGKERARHKKK